MVTAEENKITILNIQMTATITLFCIVIPKIQIIYDQVSDYFINNYSNSNKNTDLLIMDYSSPTMS